MLQTSDALTLIGQMAGQFPFSISQAYRLTQKFPDVVIGTGVAASLANSESKLL